MLTLAIDTSTKTASIALLCDSEIIAETFMNVGVHHSLTLLPAIENVCKVSRIKPDKIDLFVCTVGPGSFTGLRIGINTVKGMALATGNPLVGVSTLDALAFNLAGSSTTICPMLDAKKNQVYTALYRTERIDVLEKRERETVTDIEEFLHRLSEDVIFLGDGALKYSGTIKALLPDRAHFASGIHNQIRAASVGVLGERKYHEGDVLSPFTVTPMYLRQSEAEVKHSNRE